MTRPRYRCTTSLALRVNIRSIRELQLQLLKADLGMCLSQIATLPRLRTLDIRLWRCCPSQLVPLQTLTRLLRLTICVNGDIHNISHQSLEFGATLPSLTALESSEYCVTMNG
jgi:hypothetical protein